MKIKDIHSYKNISENYDKCDSMEESGISQDIDECGIEGEAMTSQEPSVNISSNVNSSGTKSATVSAEGEAADMLLSILRLAGMGGEASHQHGHMGHKHSPEMMSEPDPVGDDSCGGCGSWDCKSCFPENNPAQGINPPMGVGEEQNIEGDESPLTYGEENLDEEDYAYEEVETIDEIEAMEKLKGGQNELDVAPPYGELTGADFKKLRAGSVEEEYGVLEDESEKKEIIDQIMSLQNTGIAQQEYDERELEQLPMDQLTQILQQESGETAPPPEQPEPTDSNTPDQQVMEWLGRFNKLGN